MPSINKTEILRLLLAAKAVVNAKNKDGDTALMCAARYGRTKNVKLLIDASADISTKNSSKQSALTYAVHSDERHNTLDGARLLINAGADCSDIKAITLFKLKNPNLYKAAVISATTTVISTAAFIGYKLLQNYLNLLG